MVPPCIISRVLPSLEKSSGRVKAHGLCRSRVRKGKAAPSCTSHSPAAAVFPSRAGEKLFALKSKGKLIYYHAFYNPPQWGRLLNEQHCRSGEHTSTSFILFTVVLKQVQGSHGSEFNLWKHNFAAACSSLPAQERPPTFLLSFSFQRKRVFRPIECNVSTHKMRNFIHPGERKAGNLSHYVIFHRGTSGGLAVSRRAQCS